MTVAPPSTMTEDAPTPESTDAPPSPRWQIPWPAGFGRPQQGRALLLLILFLAATVRVIGSRFGFPLLVHPDEWAVVDAVVDMAKRNSFEPPWSYRPDHVEMKIDYFLFAGYAGLVKHTSIESAFAVDPLPFYWIARLATAAFGVGTVVLAYLIGRLTSLRLGLVMAALFAFFPAYVWHSHYATPDVPLTFSLLVLIYALMRYIRKPSWPSLLWSSFAVALGVGIKYPAAVGAVMIALVLAAVALRDRSWWRLVVHGAGSLGAMVGFLFVISPTLFTNFSGVRKEIEVQAAGDRLGHPDLGFIGNLKYYATTYFDFAGVVLVVLGLIGLVIVLRQRQLDRLPWFVGVFVWVSLSKLPLTWERWGLPMWITPLLLAAVGVVFLLDRFRSPRTRWIPYAAIAVVAANMLASVAMILTGLTAADTRSASLDYASSNGITAQNSIFEGYTPFLPGTSLLFFKQVKKNADGTYTFSTKEGQPAEYVVVSSGMYQRVFADKSQTDKQAIYQWIFKNATLVAQFNPAATPARSPLEVVAIPRNLGFVKDSLGGGLSGPVIKIYKLPQSAS